MRLHKRLLFTYHRRQGVFSLGGVFAPHDTAQGNTVEFRDIWYSHKRQHNVHLFQAFDRALIASSPLSIIHNPIADSRSQDQTCIQGWLCGYVNMSESQPNSHEIITTPSVAKPHIVKRIAELSLTTPVDDPIFHLELMFKMDDTFDLVLRSFRATIAAYMYSNNHATPIETASAARKTNTALFTPDWRRRLKFGRLCEALEDLARDVEVLLLLSSQNREPLGYKFYTCKWLIAKFFVNVANLKVYEETTAWLLDEEIQMVQWMKIDDFAIHCLAHDLETEHLRFVDIVAISET
jgi:hypothetical protein